MGRHSQAQNVFEVLDEHQIARFLEIPNDVWLPNIGLPMSHRGTGADAQLGAHLACTPIRGCVGFGRSGQLHQL